MAKGVNQKLKLLYLMDILLEKTDENHGITMNEIISSLESYDVSAERKSIYRDIEELQRYGLDVLSYNNGRATYYHVASRLFEIAELKLLVDAVQSSKFITEKKSRELIKKLESFASKYQAQDLLKQAQDLQDLSSSTNSQLIWIASISLLVGGIGVMNIMLVSVTERTREIGLKKAIGAKKSRILWQFLTEAAVLTSLGGIVGVGAGIGLAAIISRVTSAPVAISVPSIIIAVVFSMVIGIIFGLLPSFKAANLNPIEALRRD